MKILKQENLKELSEKCLDLLAKTAVEIGHKTDPQTLATLSNQDPKTVPYYQSQKLLK